MMSEAPQKFQGALAIDYHHGTTTHCESAGPSSDCAA